MGKLILIRHGQSTWNAENRFTGWVDVDLSEKGVLEAEKSGKCMPGTASQPRHSEQVRRGKGMARVTLR